jgi:hypothetical protein
MGDVAGDEGLLGWCHVRRGPRIGTGVRAFGVRV